MQVCLKNDIPVAKLKRYSQPSERKEGGIVNGEEWGSDWRGSIYRYD